MASVDHDVIKGNGVVYILPHDFNAKIIYNPAGVQVDVLALVAQR